MFAEGKISWVFNVDLGVIVVGDVAIFALVVVAVPIVAVATDSGSRKHFCSCADVS